MTDIFVLAYFLFYTIYGALQFRSMIDVNMADNGRLHLSGYMLFQMFFEMLLMFFYMLSNMLHPFAVSRTFLQALFMPFYVLFDRLHPGCHLTADYICILVNVYHLVKQLFDTDLTLADSRYHRHTEQLS